eukprot:Partr_v1_DN23604_c0_g1_i2_m18958 putative cytochrome c oxidase assembly
MLKIARRLATSSRQIPRRSNRPKDTSGTDAVLYVSSIFIATVGLTYAAVPLYRLVCQATGWSGTVRTDTAYLDPSKMVAKRDARRLKIEFNSDTSAGMLWDFRPQQREVYVHPGETSLVFYTATNPTERDIVGVSTYNVVPFKAGAYFNKIQCFCFEEQKLKAGESVDMPVYFYIDPDFLNDPSMDDVRDITLSYTFFPAKGFGQSTRQARLDAQQLT